jgi:ribosomal protein S25
MRWVDKYKKDGEIKRHNRTPLAYKIDKNEVKYILGEIKKNKTITMENLLVKVKEKYSSFDISLVHFTYII